MMQDLLSDFLQTILRNQVVIYLGLLLIVLLGRREWINHKASNKE